MEQYVQLAPNPKNHIKTLMRIGYDFNTAIGDIIDNSITADASKINIQALFTEDPVIAIVDNGRGMTAAELQENMRIACKDPSQNRDSHDLGRFGSGMKTASFSVARKLTVITKQNEEINACRYDIDLIEERNDWIIEILSQDKINQILSSQKISLEASGTVIIWENMPRYNASQIHKKVHDEIAADIASIRRYLAVFFHRFMSGTNKIQFMVNGDPVEPIDPFLCKEDGYQEGAYDRQIAQGGFIEMQVHILPHHDKISRELLERMGGADEIANKQGFYIYRGKRLIVEGGWLGLAKSSQLGKLARIQVDIPTTMDDHWSTDVKKSTFQYPSKIKALFKKSIASPIKKSKRVYNYRGKVEEANDVWHVNENEREEKISYMPNAENELLKSIAQRLDQDGHDELKEYLKLLSEMLPINHIHSTMASKPKNIDQEIDDKKFYEELKKIWMKL